MGLTRIYAKDSWSLTEGEETLFTVKETVKDRVVTVEASGTLRSDMEHYFYDELNALSSVGMSIVLDCKELKYISNSCLLALLRVQQGMDKTKKGELSLRNVPPNIYAECEKINLHELLMIE